MLVAENRTEMGKNTDESAGGTTNSIDPLSKKDRTNNKRKHAIIIG